MNNNIQIIERDGKPEWAVLPYDLYLHMAEDAEMLQEIQDYDTVKARIELGDEELISSEVTYAILDGKNPIKVWREYRGLSQQQLAQASGISTPYLSQLEKGIRRGSTPVLQALARILQIAVDDLLNEPS